MASLTSKWRENEESNVGFIWHASCICTMRKTINGSLQHQRKERDMPVKKGAAWKQERTTGRKYAG